MASINTYVSFKRVTRFPNNAVSLANGELMIGGEWELGMDTERPALLLAAHPSTDAEPVTVRVDLQRLIDSLVAAEAAEADRWEPLIPGDREGWWGNSILSAHVQKHEGFLQISYHRRDRAPIRDWRVGQRIKNQLAGPEWEGVELYPAESRMVDTCNEYHLWCTPQMPFGFDVLDRATQSDLDNALGEGAVQRDDPDYEGPTATYKGTHHPVRVPAAPEDFGMES